MSRAIPKLPMARAFAMASVLACAIVSPAHARVFKVGPATAGVCDYNNVQAAINFIAAQPSPDPDNTIQLVSGTYTNQRFAAGLDTNLSIIGGFSNCGASAPSGRSILDGRNTSQVGSLVYQFGTGQLKLQHLDIQFGNSSYGGGIDSEGTGTLALSDVALTSNRADWGAGIYAEGPNTTPDPPAKTVTLDGVTFTTNIATGSGGGLLVRHANLKIIGARPTWFSHNAAEGLVSGASDAGGDGAGLFALDSNVTVISHSSLATPFFYGNAAKRNGGAVYYDIADSGDFEFILANDLATRPIEIAVNSAGAEGGAVYLNSSATGLHNKLAYAAFYNVNTRFNTGNFGVISVDSSGSGNAQEPQNSMQLLLARSKPGDAFGGVPIPPCVATIDCNAIEGNVTNDRDIIGATGSNTSLTSVELSRALLRVNRAMWGGMIFGNNANISVDNSLITENIGGSIATVTYRDLHFTNDTVANNGISGPVLSALFDNSQVEVLHDIFSQPQGAPALDLLGATATTLISARDLLFCGAFVSDKLGGASNIQAAADAGFVDQSQLDFHLRADSPAIDGWQALAGDPDAPALDLDGTPRPQVIRPNNPGSFDFGAYEYYVPTATNPAQPHVIVDPIFRNSYDEQQGGN